jgi:hypothetical protein
MVMRPSIQDAKIAQRQFLETAKNQQLGRLVSGHKCGLCGAGCPMFRFMNLSGIGLHVSLAAEAHVYRPMNHVV